MSEARILRDRLADALAVRRGPEGPESDAQIVLMQTKAVGTYPTAAASFFAGSPLRVGGPEAEGAGATFVGDVARTIFAFNLGSKIPPVGTKVLAHSAGGRWVFRHDA